MGTAVFAFAEVCCPFHACIQKVGDSGSGTYPPPYKISEYNNYCLLIIAGLR